MHNAAGLVTDQPYLTESIILRIAEMPFTWIHSDRIVCLSVDAHTCRLLNVHRLHSSECDSVLVRQSHCMCDHCGFTFLVDLLLFRISAAFCCLACSRQFRLFAEKALVRYKIARTVF